MKFNINKKYISIGIVAFLVICAAILFWFATFKLKELADGINNILDVLEPVVFGFIFAYLLNPLLKLFEHKLFYPSILKQKKCLPPSDRKRIRVLSLILTFFVVFMIIYIFIKSVAPQLGRSIEMLAIQLPNYIDFLEKWINSLFSENSRFYQNYIWFYNMFSDVIGERLGDYVNVTLLPQAKEILKNLSSGIFNALTSLWNCVIGLIISIYVLLTKEKFAGQAKKIIYSLFSNERANSFLKDIRFVSDTFIGFFGGKIIDSFIIGILCFIGCSIISLPYSVLISVVIGITNIIPFFGPLIGAVPCSFLLLMVKPIDCLYFIIFIIILQQIDGNIIGPKILGNSTGISGFWVIFAITVFGGLWGVIGMFIGIPLFAVLYAIIKRKIDARLKNKNMPTETGEFITVKSIDSNGEITYLAEADDNFFMPVKKEFKIKNLVNKKCKENESPNDEDDEIE